MRRRFLFASALVSLTVTAPAAFADRDITDEITTPVATSTAGDGGVADNIVISASGRVTVSPGSTAVTMDSDHSITNNGSILIDGDGDDGVGIHIVGGSTGTLTHNGSIQVVPETRATDTDDPVDGRVNGPNAYGSNRVAILVDGAAVFTGDIITASSSGITVVGNDSAGLRILTGIDGNLALNGLIRLTGDNGQSVDVSGDVSGDVRVNGTISAVGVGSQGVALSSDVGGAVRIGASITTTSYRFAGHPSDELLPLLNTDDTAMSGSGLVVNGSVAGGVYIAGQSETFPNEVAGSVSVRTTAPATHIFADANSGDIVLGEIVLEAVEDDPDTADVDESIPAQHLGYAFVNRGTINAQGDLDGVDSFGMRVEGLDGNTVTFEGGIENANRLNVTAYEATGTGVFIGNGAIVPTFANSGVLIVGVNGVGGTGRGVFIDTGANVPSFINTGTLNVNGVSGGSAYSLIDLSGTLTSVENTGLIRTTYSAPPTGTDPVAYETVAIDLSAGTLDSIVRQYLHADAPDGAVVSIIGDIRFGSGADQFQVETGTVSGDVNFGDGADQLVMSGNSVVAGVVSDSDGLLDIEIDNAELQLAAETNLSFTTARFGDGSVLRFQIDDETSTAASIHGSGTVTFESGSRVSATLSNLIGEGATFVVLTADELVIEETLASLQDTDAPWLYESNLEFDPNDDNALVLTLRRRTAEELGMNANQGAAYAAALEGWQGNEELGQAIASLMTQDEFFSAYDQLLPEYSASAIQFALAANDSAVGALSNRLEAVRRSPEETGGLWVQEFGYFADRAGSAFGPGYRGHGIGLAAGFDRPFGPFYALGVNIVGAASEVSEVDGVDEPMSAITAQVGTYAGAHTDMFDVDLYAAVGYDTFEHNRRVLIGAFDAAPSADWTGWHASGSARIARDIAVTERWYVRPAFSVDYLRLSESAYVETGGGVGVDLSVGDRETTSFSGTGLLTLGARFEGTDSWWSPTARVGFRNEFADSDAETTASFADFDDTFTLRSQAMPGTGAIFGFGIAAGSGYSTFSFDYDADVREDFIRHTARLVMRMVF
ncbi:autotransporter outer membrane beta-barrel domain-containing protein [Maricaulis sp.]|uniref:autotransporter family protein n=1 Tax=Maricaulis sp. TaxID=1486257 RepID=UPI0025C64803|nr:autotransporter outer membrane beta-barrel domain-containing protein [Maricaulis sp.]